MDDVLIIGAGPAGLACAACLARSGLSYRIVERAGTVGASWRRHYDRLHLHTDRGHSGLPGHPMPRSYPRYPTRDQVVAYLEDYAARLPVAPEFEIAVEGIERDAVGAWRVSMTTSAGETASATAKAVIVATGYCEEPIVPRWPGIDDFAGEVVHSSHYRNGAPFKDRAVLVVGFGNSGGEIALDLAEHGSRPILSVRGPVNAVPRDVLGIPILTLSILLRPIPTRIADGRGAPWRLMTVGRLDRFGLEPAPYGPLTQIRREGRIPLLDVGTLGAIRDGRIAVRPDIDRFAANTVRFADGREDGIDAVVLATGYRPRLAALIDETAGALDELLGCG